MSHHYHRHGILSNRFAVGKRSRKTLGLAFTQSSSTVGSHRLASPTLLFESELGPDHLTLVSEMCITAKEGMSWMCSMANQIMASRPGVALCHQGRGSGMFSVLSTALAKRTRSSPSNCSLLVGLFSVSGCLVPYLNCEACSSL